MLGLKIYSPLDLRFPNLSPRTGLYPLLPIGVGTAMIESLTSYLTRLAQAHDISTRTLIAGYLRFRIPTAQVADASQDNNWNRHFLDYAHTLNGMTDRVEDWIFALEECTGVANLRFSTMAIWKGIFSHRGLLRSKRAWCAFCYHEWQASGQTIYEPLLWALADVSTCPRHQRTLTGSCPHCRYRPHVLMPRSRPGCCPHCHHWLGSKITQAPTSGSDTGSHDSRVKTDGIAQLLASAPLIQQPPSKHIMWTNLQSCVRDLAGGNASVFGRGTGLNPCTFVFWFAGCKLPAFTSLNKLCYRLGMPLFRFLTERLVAGDPDWENARTTLSLHETQVQPNNRRRAVLPSQGFCPAEISDQEIKRVLQCALRENPPPTIPHIAGRLGIPRHRIYTHFPGFYKALRAARQSQLEAAAKAALLESPPPTLRELEKQRGLPRVTLRACFPSLYHELAARSAQRRFRKREETKRILQVACAEDPPPSGRVLAARLGSNRGYLKKIFPESWQLVLQRHAEYRKQEVLRKRVVFTERVQRIVANLLLAGKYPSRRRVLALMGGSELRGESLILPEVKRVILAFPSE